MEGCNKIWKEEKTKLEIYKTLWDSNTHGTGGL